VALGVGAAPLRGVEIEAPGELGDAGGVRSTAEAGEDVDRLSAGEVGPELDVAGDVGEAAVQGHEVDDGVLAEDLDAATVGAQQAEDDAQRRRLAGAVGAEEAVDLPAGDLEVEAVEGAGAPVGLGELGGADDSGHRGLPVGSAAPTAPAGTELGGRGARHGRA